MPNIHDSKTHFSRLITRVENGEKITISRAGKPVARLVPYEGETVRSAGILKGKIQIGVDFDSFDEEIADSFAGE